MIRKIPLSIKVLVIEFLVTIGLYLNGIKCGDPCPSYSFTNPFGFTSSVNNICTNKECLVYQPHPLFYLTFDIFIITLFIFLVSFTIKKLIKR